MEDDGGKRKIGWGSREASGNSEEYLIISFLSNNWIKQTICFLPQPTKLKAFTSNPAGASIHAVPRYVCQCRWW